MSQANEGQETMTPTAILLSRIYAQPRKPVTLPIVSIQRGGK